MPIIFEVQALYRRTVKPADYESATGEVGLKAQMEDGDNVDEVVAALLHKCRDLTMKAVTGKKLGRTEATVSVTKKEAEAEAPRKVSTTPEDRGEQEDALPGEEDTAAVDAEIAQRAAEKKAVAAEKRKATAAAKKIAAAAAAAAPAAVDEFGEGAEEKLEAPADDSGDYDASAFAEEAGISATDLQQFISTTVSDKRITVPKAKEIMSQFGNGAGRVKDIPVEKRDEVYEKIQAALTPVE